MRRLWLVAALIAAVVLWRVGEAHKTACVNAGKVNCSLLPWSGNLPGAAGAGSGGTLQGVSSSVHYLGGSESGAVSGSASSIP